MRKGDAYKSVHSHLYPDVETSRQVFPTGQILSFAAGKDTRSAYGGDLTARMQAFSETLATLGPRQAVFGALLGLLRLLALYQQRRPGIQSNPPEVTSPEHEEHAVAVRYWRHISNIIAVRGFVITEQGRYCVVLRVA